MFDGVTAKGDVQGHRIMRKTIIKLVVTQDDAKAQHSL